MIKRPKVENEEPEAVRLRIEEEEKKRKGEEEEKKRKEEEEEEKMRKELKEKSFEVCVNNFFLLLFSPPLFSDCLFLCFLSSSFSFCLCLDSMKQHFILI